MVSRALVVTDVTNPAQNGNLVILSQDDLATVNHSFRVFIGITDPSGVEIHPYQEIVPDIAYNSGATSFMQKAFTLIDGKYLTGTYKVKIKEEFIDNAAIIPTWTVNNMGEASFLFKPDVISPGDPQAPIVSGIFAISCVTGDVTFTDTSVIPAVWTTVSRSLFRLEIGATPDEVASFLTGFALPIRIILTALEWNGREFTGKLTYNMSRQESPQAWFVVTFQQGVSVSVKYLATCDFNSCGIATATKCFLDGMDAESCKSGVQSAEMMQKAAKLNLLLNLRALKIACGDWIAVQDANKEILTITSGGCGCDSTTSAAMTKFVPVT